MLVDVLRLGVYVGLVGVGAMNLYRVTDESKDAKPDPEVFVKANSCGAAVWRAECAMLSGNTVPRVKLNVELICDLDACYICEANMDRLR